MYVWRALPWAVRPEIEPAAPIIIPAESTGSAGRETLLIHQPWQLSPPEARGAPEQVLCSRGMKKVQASFTRELPSASESAIFVYNSRKLSDGELTRFIRLETLALRFT